MKIRAPRRAILDAAKIVTPFATGATPALNGVRLRTVGDLLEVTCSDLDITVTTLVDADIETPGVAVPPARILAGFLGAAGCDTVTLDLDDHDLTVTSGDTSAMLRCYPIDGWPADHEAEGDAAYLDATALDLIERVAKAAKAPSAKLTADRLYTGICFRDGEVLATDNHRAAFARIGDDIGEAVIPASVLASVLKAAPDGCRLTLERNRATFATDAVRWTCRTLEGQFADVHRLTRSSSPYGVDVVIAPLLESIKRMRVLHGDPHYVTFTFDGDKAILTSKQADVGEITDVVAVSTTFAERIRFDSHYLADLLESCTTDEITLGLDTGLKPAQVTTGPLTQLVMPLRIGAGE